MVVPGAGKLLSDGTLFCLIVGGWAVPVPHPDIPGLHVLDPHQPLQGTGYPFVSFTFHVYVLSGILVDSVRKAIRYLILQNQN